MRAAGHSSAQMPPAEPFLTASLIGQLKWFIQNSDSVHIRSTLGVKLCLLFHNLLYQTIMIAKQNQNRRHSWIQNLLQNLLVGTVGILMACSITACGEKNAQVASQETGGSQAERVAEITKMLGRSAPLPGPLLDAQFVEEKTGDGRLGPSDFKSFYALTVAPSDLPAWKAALSKSQAANSFSNDDEIKRAAPKKAQAWWVSGADLGKLEFFSPHSLTGNANGWAGISPDGRIYVHVFTM